MAEEEYAKQGHGMTFQEIADELGITNGGAQYIFNSAIQKLRRKEMKLLLKMKEEASGLKGRTDEH